MLNLGLVRLQRGVTLIELLLGIVILAVVLSLGLPSFQVFIQNGRIRMTAESIMAGLQLARAEAVSRNASVSFVLGADNGWTVSVDGTGEQIQARSAGEGAATVTATVTGSNTVTFNSFGRIRNADPLTKVVFDISDATRDMQVEIVAPGGQVRLCEPGITTAGDVRRCLQ